MKHSLFFILTLLTTGVLAQDNWEEVQKKERAIRTNESKRTRIANKGAELANTNQIDSAMMYYRKALEMDRSKHYVSYNIGLLFQSTQSLDSAIKYYSISLEAHPKFTDAVLQRGIAYFQKGDDSLAVVDLDKVLQINPMYDSFAHPYRALAKFNLKQFEGALTDFDKAVTFYPDDDRLWYNRGVCKFGMGDIEGALKDFHKTLQLKPNNKLALEDRAGIYWHQKKYSEALEDLKKCLTYTADNAFIHFKMGAIYLEMKNPDQSLFHLNQAEQLGYNTHELFYNKGLGYYYLTKDAEAIANFNKCLSIKPDFAMAYGMMGVCKNASTPKSGCEDLQKAIILGLQEVQATFDEACGQ